MKNRTRFAPSPTGYMHIGNLRTALYEYLIAKSAGGDFILRIEDTDQKRYVEGATDIIFKTLKRVGMNWDEGPDIGGNFGPYVQSERRKIYQEYAHKLVELGGAHYCFCAQKEENEEADEDTPEAHIKFKDPCLKISLEEAKKRVAAGEPYTIRQTINKKGTSVFHDVVYGDIEIDYDELDAFFSVNKKLADKYGMQCWTNAETFDRDMPIQFLPIKFDKLRMKLEAAARCSYDKAITFEFSHFMSPQSAYLQAGHLYDRYREYFEI